jgi:adenine phosphoribosyltransferase
MCRQVVLFVAEAFKEDPPDAVAGIESRGFLFGMMLASHFDVPFIPVRKSGKLPFEKISHSYTLEYGEATIEMHTDAIHQGMKVLIHDDLLATGGTAHASSQLVKKLGGDVLGYSFLIELSFLEGRTVLNDAPVSVILKY